MRDEFTPLPSITVRPISLDAPASRDRFFIPNVIDFGVAGTLSQIEETLAQKRGGYGEVVSAFLRDVAATKRELLAQEPDLGAICVGLLVTSRFLAGAVRGRLLSDEIAQQVPEWRQRIEASFRVVFLTLPTDTERWIEFLNSSFGPEHRVRSLSEFSDIDGAI